MFLIDSFIDLLNIIAKKKKIYTSAKLDKESSHAVEYRYQRLRSLVETRRSAVVT